MALVPLLEIIIIAVMVNFILSFCWNTKSMDLVVGLGAFLAIFAATNWLHLPVLREIMYVVANVAVLAILIIFQPELRVALSKLSWKGRRYREITAFDKFLDQLATSVYRLSDKHTGALIILEHEHSLTEFANKGVLLNARFTPELLESIFTTTTPLHDGAVIIRDLTLVAAACILPLAEDGTDSPKTMGTRHRAALGLSQLSDALVIVVSEETGKVSIARQGVMTRGVKTDRLKGIIRSLFSPPHPEKDEGRLRLLGWLKR